LANQVIFKKTDRFQDESRTNQVKVKFAGMGWKRHERTDEERHAKEGIVNWFALNRGQAAVALTNTESAAETAFLDAAALHERYLDAVYRYVARRVGQRQEAEDITAEVFAAASQSLSRKRPDTNAYLWLLGIARRKVADAHRLRAKRRELLASELPDGEGETDVFSTLAASVAGPEAALQRQEAHSELRRIVMGLKAEQREALLLRYVEELSVAEVAVVMQRSPKAINSLLQRARAAIFRQGQGYFLGESEGTK
jgi:RNA polymerase sigma-70 factor (ECF subfamily)